MEVEILKYLSDVRDAVSAILKFVEDKTYEDYREDDLLISGVERKFEIIGEALNRIKRSSPQVLDKIRDHRSIISFRNILAHGYDSIDLRIVWDIIEESLDTLYTDVDELLEEAEQQNASNPRE